jgi:hypothetical protein
MAASGAKGEALILAKWEKYFSTASSAISISSRMYPARYITISRLGKSGYFFKKSSYTLTTGEKSF